MDERKTEQQPGGDSAAGSSGPRVRRADGVTQAERYLGRLCDHTFLSLWSYQGVFRDQGRIGGRGDGKELCDLLVVFENDIIIFSDKHCVFKDTGNLELDWKRWFKKAVHEASDQIWGAERWLKEHGDRIFLDRACTQPFPLALPDLTVTRFHRVVVAHGISERCKNEMGGSGSLAINPSVVGKMHYGEGLTEVPVFTIGQLNPLKGFVHVLDDISLDVLLGTLDTITDFVTYLRKKEQLILDGRLAFAAGEDDLLGYYLKDINEQGEHDFTLPPEHDALVVSSGHWDYFVSSPEHQSQIAADRVSYLWDRLIESFNSHILAGTQYWSSHPAVADQERSIRFLARESRFRRRMLAVSLLEAVQTTSESQRRLRVVPSQHPTEPCYVFLLFPQPRGVSEEEYREVRFHFLVACCRVAKLRYPEVLDIVGVATESGNSQDMLRSEDILYYDGRLWDDDERAEAQSLQKDLGLLINPQETRRHEREYPYSAPASSRPAPNVLHMKGRDRNAPCPCGSGKKFKKCCG